MDNLQTTDDTPRIDLGKKQFPHTINRGGQHLRQFEHGYLFELEDGLYKKAGQFHWKNFVESGDEPVPGIGINKRIVNYVYNHDKPLIVYNAKQDVHYKLLKEEALNKIKGREQDGKLVIFPISAFQTVEVTTQ